MFNYRELREKLVQASLASQKGAEPRKGPANGQGAALSFHDERMKAGALEVGLRADQRSSLGIGTHG